MFNRIKKRIQMYDLFLANLASGDSVIGPEVKLDNSKISVGFSNIASENFIYKYFLMKDMPDYIDPNFLDNLRHSCLLPGVKFNYYIYSNPHQIRWDSAEMKNRLNIWKEYTAKQPDDINVFEYRQKRSISLTKQRLIHSTKFLNEAELDYKRTTSKITFLIELAAKREEQYMLNLSRSIRTLKTLSRNMDLKIRELRFNIMDWLAYLGIFSLKEIPEIVARVNRRIVTDDILASMNPYKQGHVGETGVCLGIDIMTKAPVLKKFKADPDAPENWLICAETGGGKSMYIKVLLTYLLAAGFVVTVMDYEGDEYLNLASYIRASNPDDVKVISMGKGSTEYFDPMEIADLTGDPDIDDDLKENATAYTLAIFRIIIGGLEGKLTQWEERVISMAIKRVYKKAGVTEDKNTWIKSKGLRVRDVYQEIKKIAETKELLDSDIDNIKHKACVKIADAASIYFEEGEAKSGTFKNPLSVNELYKARFIVFSFGMRGATSSQIDPVILALKQLSVANVAIQISNYCKFIKKCFNVKVWEEFQRWGEVRGSSEIILNAMTGGRKRGDVNFIITNKLGSILDENNPIATGLRENITSKAIGKINDKSVRQRFCKTFSVPELQGILDTIAKAGLSNTETLNARGLGSKYKYAFCIMLDNGKKTVVKVMLPKVIRQSQLFKTGIDINEGQD